MESSNVVVVTEGGIERLPAYTRQKSRPNSVCTRSGKREGGVGENGAFVMAGKGLARRLIPLLACLDCKVYS